MSDAETAKVVASGPLFKGEGDRFARCRVLLLKMRHQDSKRLEYVVGLQTLSAIVSEPGSLLKLHRTRHFTRAVRLFCDSVLEQAQEDDMAYDTLFGPTSWVAR
jgi:hypothetical protein